MTEGLNNFYLGTVDYVVFAFMLLLSACTGIYFACRSKIFKNRSPDTLQDYLTGNKDLKPVPVAMSLIASYISGVTMLGTPAEIYNFGAQYWLIVLSMTLSGITVAYVYLPVFRKLEVCSSYEYLELRFNKTLRTVASIFFLFDEIMFLPMLIYVPSLAFSQVSGINLHIIGAIVCAICVFYTVLGGLRAVVYTDTWQTIFMFISDIVVVIVGIVTVGGFGTIIARGIAGDRLQNLNFSPNMTERYTVFSVLIGGYVYWTAFNAVNQTMVQRYLSLATDRKAKISIALFTFGVVFFISLCCFAGILVYATYYKCDPLAAHRVTRTDQILPLFVVETAGHLYGIPGLFMAGVFGAALSSLSVVLNSSAVVLLEDVCTGACHLNITEAKARIISKIVIVTLGVFACTLVLVIEQMGGIFEVATSLSAISAGTMFGVFSLGMLIPWSNSIGAIAGAIAGFLAASITAFGQQYYSVNGGVVPVQLEKSVEDCLKNYNINITSVPEIHYPDETGIFILFRLSYLWITPIGFITVIIVGVITSFATGKTDTKTLDPELISPICHSFLPPESKEYAGSAVKKVEHQRLLGGFTRLTASTTSIKLNAMQSQEGNAATK